MRGASESLAGRVEFVELGGFDLRGTGPASWERLWVRGGFPRSWLARSNADSLAWREGLIRTFLERDVPQLGIGIPAPMLRRFWTRLAHYHGQTWNASAIAGSMGLSDTVWPLHAVGALPVALGNLATGPARRAASRPSARPRQKA